MDADAERSGFLRGIELFNAGEYFEAHEVWEDLWHAAQGPARSFYQGLIQCAVALEHYRRANPRGVVSLFRSYPKKFAGLPAVFMGLDVGAFLRDMRRALGPVIDAPQLPQKGSVWLDMSTAPRIALREPGLSPPS